MEHSNTTVSSGKFGQIWVSTFYTHLHTYIPFVKVGTGFCPIGAFGRTPGHRRLAKCDAGSSRTGGFSPLRRGFSALLRDLPARWRSVGFFGCAAHTPAAGAQSRTQRRHAPHGAAQALGLPTGSIGSMLPTVGRSALSALRSEISRFPLLR